MLQVLLTGESAGPRTDISRAVYGFLWPGKGLV